MKNFCHPMLGLRHAGAANVASEVPQPGEEPLRQVRGDPAAGRRVRRQRLHPEDAQVEDGLDLVLVGGLARVVLGGLAEPVDVHPQVQRFFSCVNTGLILLKEMENRTQKQAGKLLIQVHQLTTISPDAPT